MINDTSIESQTYFKLLRELIDACSFAKPISSSLASSPVTLAPSLAKG